MSRIVQIKDGVVINCIVADLEWALANVAEGFDSLLEHNAAGPGWLVQDGELVPPPEVPAEPVELDTPLTRLAFTRRFTLSERIAIRSSTDPIVIDGMAMLEVAESIKIDDPDTVALVNYFAQQGLISVERVTEILGE